MGNHCIVDFTLCVDHVLKFLIFVYNYNTDDGHVEIEKNLLKNQENMKKQTLNFRTLPLLLFSNELTNNLKSMPAFHFLAMSIKKFIALLFDFNNFIKQLIALHKTQNVRLSGSATRFDQSKLCD